MSETKVNSIHLYKLVPNMFTILALCLGITSVRYGMDSKFVTAASLILIAGFFDGIDGRMARLLNCSSSFGAQLDSLADIVSFGVSPSLLMYFWSLHSVPYKGVGWTVVLVYIACSALRLARFNVQQEDPSSNIIGKYFFTGIPIPAAAGLSLMPMIITFEITDWVMPSWAVCVYILIIGFMMVSNIPTFSMKKISVNRSYVTWLLLAAGMIIAFVILDPWTALPIISLLYCLSIPCSIVYHKKMILKLGAISRD
jgi:CDP-diacylglycerol--serine O-phosphatidyltransferase